MSLPPPRASSNVELVSLDELLRNSDVISLHTSLSPATEKMFDAAAIAKMKRGARLINCARGELIDEAALAEALKSGQLPVRPLTRSPKSHQKIRRSSDSRI